MTERKRFKIHYTSLLKGHLGVIERKYYGLIRRTIEEQLTFEPNVKTRNRKPVHQPSPFDAGWEIRFGVDNRFRVFYDVDLEAYEVNILAIGEKEGNRLYIGGEDVTKGEGN